jgi:hypothetical protein
MVAIMMLCNIVECLPASKECAVGAVKIMPFGDDIYSCGLLCLFGNKVLFIKRDAQTVVCASFKTSITFCSLFR